MTSLLQGAGRLVTRGTDIGARIEGLATATDAAEAALRQFEGPDGFDAPMSAHLVTATK